MGISGYFIYFICFSRSNSPACYNQSTNLDPIHLTCHWIGGKIDWTLRCHGKNHEVPSKHPLSLKPTVGSLFPSVKMPISSTSNSLTTFLCWKLFSNDTWRDSTRYETLPQNDSPHFCPPSHPVACHPCPEVASYVVLIREFELSPMSPVNWKFHLHHICHQYIK